MAKPQDDSSKKSAWDVAGSRIGVISGAIGLAVTVLGLPNVVADALGRSESETSRLELENQRAAVAAAGPRLELSYLFSSAELIGIPPADKQSASKNSEAAAATLSSLPFVENEIRRESVYERPTCGLGETVERSLGFLVIRNRGQRDADRITVRVARLQLSKPVRIRELPGGGGDDYAAKLRDGSTATSTVNIEIPTTLGAGDGIRVPLFWSVARYGRHDEWCVNSSHAYLPLSVASVDPVIGRSTRQKVRRMADPVVLGYGVYGRG